MVFSVFINYFARSLYKLYMSKFNVQGTGKLVEHAEGKLYSKNMVDSIDGTIIALFYPELLSETSINDLRELLDQKQAKANSGKIHVLTFFCSIWAL